MRPDAARVAFPPGDVGRVRRGARGPTRGWTAIDKGAVVSTVMSRLVQRVMSLPAALDRRVRGERGVRVPMDDGVELAGDMYTPAGAGPHPTILVRSPYGRGGPLGFVLGRVFAERGYRVVMQSCRGTFGSDGE